MGNKKDTIEEKLQEIDEIVKRFEEGNVDIEEGIAEYENAIKIFKDIKQELEAKELKIKEIRDLI